MTGGRVVILGPVGINFAAGMSGLKSLNPEPYERERGGGGDRTRERERKSEREG